MESNQTGAPASGDMSDVNAQQRQSLQAEIEANQDYAESLKKVIQETTPYISDQLDLGVLKEEYRDNKFENAFSELYARYKLVRRLRRDGNCFYRAFLFTLFEFFVKEKGPQYQAFIKVVQSSKDELVAHGGYDLIAVEDFYDVFFEAVEKLKDVPKDQATEHCLKLLSNNEDANYIIMYARFMCATHMKKNAILFEDFLGTDMQSFCLTEVEQLDVECDQPQIMGIIGFLNLGVEINAVQADGSVHVTILPEEGYDGFRPKLLYVPGHYDALYE